MQDFIEWIKNKLDHKDIPKEILTLERKLTAALAEAKDGENGGVSYAFGVTQDDVNDYIRNAKIDENVKDYLKYAKPTSRLINDVEKEIDVKDYVHALRDNDIRHIYNSHGENTNEKYPITESDIELIPHIVENYDKVFVKTNQRGEPGIVYVKVAENNLIYYVEAATVRYHNEKLLINKQMIKTGIDTIPNLYGLEKAINKKESSSQYLADLKKIHKAYARSVKENYSNHSISNNSDNVKSLNDRLSGDVLLNAKDLIETVRSVGGDVDKNGYITVYHRTTEQSKEKILSSGHMKAKEDGIFFSTKKDGQADGYGDSIVKMNIPAEKLILDDIFSDEAHLRYPLRNRNAVLDVSEYITKNLSDISDSGKQHSFSLDNSNDITETSQFKKWFGDWENDPKHASKIVNEDGTPKVVYHGTGNFGFSVFKGLATEDNVLYQDSGYSYGIYFTDDLEVAKTYSGSQEITSLNGAKYYDYDNMSAEEIADYLNKYCVKDERDRYEAVSADEIHLTTRFGNIYKYGLEAMRDLARNQTSPSSGIYAAYLSVKNPLVVQTPFSRDIELPDELRAVVKKINPMVFEKRGVPSFDTSEIAYYAEKAGYDGVIFEGIQDVMTGYGGDTRPASTIVVFDPTQIKSATENIGTFDRTNPDIRYSFPLDNSNDVGYNNTINREVNSYEPTDEFRRLQEESRRMSEEEIQQYHAGKELSDEIRRRLSGTFKLELESSNSERFYSVRSLLNPKTNNKISLYEGVDSSLFHDVFEIARCYLENGELVDLHEVNTTEDGIGYKDCLNFLSKDGLSGFSITPDGDLISVFNLNSEKGFLKTIAPIVKEKTKTLDCYNSPNQPLREMYSKVFGFKTASVMEYNMEYDHDNIAENHGSPQVAFMVNTPENVETRYFTENQYDEAVAYRDSFLNGKQYSFTEDSTPDENITLKAEDLTRRYRNGEITTDEYARQQSELWDKANEQYGSIEKGEKPKANVDVPKTVDGTYKTRRFARTALEVDIGDRIATEQVRSDILTGKLAYKTLSDQVAIKHAEDAIRNGTAESKWAQAYAEGKFDKNTVAIGEALMRMYAERHDNAKLVNILSEIAEVGTTAGQTVQAMSLLKDMDGVSQLVYVRKVVDRLNNNLEKRYKNKKNVPHIELSDVLVQPWKIGCIIQTTVI